MSNLLVHGVLKVHLKASCLERDADFVSFKQGFLVGSYSAHSSELDLKTGVNGSESVNSRKSAGLNQQVSENMPQGEPEYSSITAIHVLFQTPCNVLIQMAIHSSL
jgi:hypothetical protein